MRIQWLIAPTAIVAAASGYAAEYLTPDEAKRAVFPEADGFEALSLSLSKEQEKTIEKAARSRFTDDHLNVWKAQAHGHTLGYVWIDRVIGKHELITYAVGITPEGSVKQVEIMDYRETYGGEVQSKTWRQQFVGKKSSDPLALGEDVKNISGATLSCRNVTNGVRRLLATQAALIQP